MLSNSLRPCSDGVPVAEPIPLWAALGDPVGERVGEGVTALVGDGFWLGVGGRRRPSGSGCGGNCRQLLRGTRRNHPCGGRVFTVGVSAGAGCVAPGTGVAPEQPNRAARMTRNGVTSSFGTLDTCVSGYRVATIIRLTPVLSSQGQPPSGRAGSLRSTMWTCAGSVFPFFRRASSIRARSGV